MPELEDQIAAGKILPVYVLSGVPLLVDRVVGALGAGMVTPVTRPFNFDAFDGKALVPTILQVARTVPMMGRRRLVVVREVESLDPSGLGLLAGYLEAPTPETTLVLVAGKVDGRLKLFAAAKKKGWLHDLAAPRALGSWIAEEARRQGAQVMPDASRRLEEVCGKDLGRLAQVLEQLALYVDKGRITVEDVDDLVADTSERTVFQLTDAVGQGNRAAAFRAVAKLFEMRESPIGLVIMLARHFRQLAIYKECLAAGTPKDELPRLIGVPPFVMDKSLGPQSRRFSSDKLQAAISLLAETDRSLKGATKAALGEQVVVERLVDQLLQSASSAGPTSSPAPRRAS